MEFVVAVAVLVVGFALARVAAFDPDDYVHAAGLAVVLGIVIFTGIPNPDKAREQATLGAPLEERARSAFLQEHGMKIVAACGLVAAGALAEAALRRRRPYEPWN